jgi:hypothetical protein
LILDEHLREDILSGKRKRKLKNVTINPLQVKVIKKLSTIKSIPYQTLIRSWLAEGIKSEMDSVLRARAKITSHFKRRCILPGGVAKARNMLDIPALFRLARQAPQHVKSVN